MDAGSTDQNDLGRDAILALLEFHVAAGVDLALDEAPHDRFAEAALAREQRVQPPERAEARPLPPPRAAQAAQTAEAPSAFDPARFTASAPARPLPKAATAAPEEAAADARRRAATATSLAELEAIVAAFDGCALKASARQLAFADGVPGSRVMLVGEAPGAEEDRVGRPFVGRAGQLLDRMLAAIDLDRSHVYIANVVPWRPPGNRTPTPQEIAICRPFIERQIELARPEILVTVGAPATQSLLGLKEGIFRLRGRWSAFETPAGPIRALPMLHPAYLLRQPAHKRHAWRDLQALRRALDGVPEPGERPPIK
jgi:uracil-DNA glycosylase family 4